MKLRILIAFFLLPLVSYSQKQDQELIDSLLTEVSKAKDDTSRLYLFHKIIQTHISFKPEEGLQYEKPALMIAQKAGRHGSVAIIKAYIGRLYWRMGSYDEALKRHFEALKIYEEEDNEKLSALTYVYLGQDYADGGKYASALNYFTKAMKKYRALNDRDHIGNLHFLFAWIYAQQGNYLESSKANMEALRIYEALSDSNAIAIAMSNIGDDMVNMGNFTDAFKYYANCTEILKNTGDQINLSTTYNSIGKAYSLTGNYSAALKNYIASFTIARDINNSFLAGVAYNSIGNDCQAQGKYDQAINSYLKAIAEFKSVSNKQELASLYSDIGICYTRLKQYDNAQNYFGEAFALSNELNSKTSAGNYYKGVEMLDSATGNWHDAYFNYKHYISIKDSVLSYESAKKIVGSQMQYESEKKEIAVKAEQDKKDFRQKIIRNCIAAGLAGALVFLVVVFRQRNKISKARKRSDELLLNILPEEVADELKEKGSADAKQFDEVTVMFTDFKGFTQISEKLSAKELVAEIHTCFKSFDDIISKHNIEKIKTIGDSYMCAGGLPVANKTHAKDVVKAALEIQKFMHEHLQERKNANKEIFEIRIGIHTGTVVAGIVGVKKFAYDIWGDTVNIASRMESSGEAGKVNISGSTYALVKDQFNCIHRGKIQAKNKGEIDMYFVEN